MKKPQTLMLYQYGMDGGMILDDIDFRVEALPSDAQNVGAH
jgi:hypothetical protein